MSAPRSSVSVVIPVLNGARYLEELLAALAAQDELEVLVIDSGSRDGSQAIARAAGAQLLEIPPEQFGHGRTRNLGAERTSGELICFLTQDATPLPGWLAAMREAFALDRRVGAAFGPHLPRPDTSPMIARELTEFFAGLAPDGRPTVQRRGDNTFLSNVNACYARACWEEIRFPEVAYAEDQAFGRVMLESGWTKVYHPAAAVLHAHDYGAWEFMRRYFDEYRGLRETIDHVEPFGARSAAAAVGRLVAADNRWMAAHGYPPRERIRWTGRAVVHHGGRKVFSALGSRAERLPAPVQRAISLERRAADLGPAGRGLGRGRAAGPSSASAEPAISAAPRGRRVRGEPYYPHPYTAVARYYRDGPASLAPVTPADARRTPLHIAVVVPPWQRGSGGHSSIFQIVSQLERIGHTCSIWIDDPFGYMSAEREAVARSGIREHFVPIQAPVLKGFARWWGADIAIATGWQTVFPTLLLENCRARAYLVHDHESEFYETSVESCWAEDTYRQGLYSICASPWLLDLVSERYGGRGCTFAFGVDHDVYRPQPVARRRDTVIFYGRWVTGRRATPLGVLALEELKRRRPDVRIVTFGTRKPLQPTFSHEFLGVVSPRELAWAYSEATVGLVLSMTNYSLIPQEMMACGLPCVDLAGPNNELVYGADGPVELAAFTPMAIADALQRLLEDSDRWRSHSRAGQEFVADRSWAAAAAQVERGIRAALAERLAVAPAASAAGAVG